MISTIVPAETPNKTNNATSFPTLTDRRLLSISKIIFLSFPSSGSGGSPLPLLGRNSGCSLSNLALSSALFTKVLA